MPAMHRSCLRFFVRVGECALTAPICLAACGGDVDSGLSPSVRLDAGTIDVTSDDTGAASDSQVTEEGPGVVVEPSCPDAEPPAPMYGCDPFAAPPGACPPGKACRPYVIEGSGWCDPAEAVTECLPAGAGQAGALCAAQAHCAAGYFCTSGLQYTCQRLCKTQGPSTCNEGEICEALANLPGIGTCK